MAGAVFLGLTATSGRAFGVVGEVAAGWALPDAPEVWSSLDPPATSERAWGPLVVRATRPMLSVRALGAEAPLAINTYTGGPPDWPARLLTLSTGTPAAGRLTHALLGLCLLVLAHRFLRFHASFSAAGAAALILATDWSFVLWRSVLGGTEVLLAAANLLVIWALWSRRWKGGHHGATAIAFGVGLGLLAKITFAASLAGVALAAWISRGDRAPMRPPPPARPVALVAIVLVCVSPLALAALLHGTLDAPIPSHDTLDLQVRRLIGGWAGAAPAREGLHNLAAFLGDPRASFAAAYGATAVSAFSPLRAAGHAITLLGAALAWRDRVRSPSEALLRFLALAVPAQIAAITLANRDLHHLGPVAVPLALLAALAADRVAGELAPPRSVARAALVAALVSPQIVAGVWQLRGTDAVVASIHAPAFTERGQAALVEALRAHHVRRVVTSDYELYGMLEVRAPEIEARHAWGAVARRAPKKVGPAILRAARGGHYLTVRPTARLAYNWSPDAGGVTRAATEAGVVVTPVQTLTEGDTVVATLWRVD